MNKVKNVSGSGPITWTVRDLIGDSYSQERTAFIGQCGNGDKNTLYLIIYTGVVLASNPFHLWESKGCDCYVDRFVDVEITAIERTTQ
jgi:hypothetical protein